MLRFLQTFVHLLYEAFKRLFDLLAELQVKGLKGKKIIALYLLDLSLSRHIVFQCSYLCFQTLHTIFKSDDVDRLLLTRLGLV